MTLRNKHLRATVVPWVWGPDSVRHWVRPPPLGSTEGLKEDLRCFIWGQPHANSVWSAFSGNWATLSLSFLLPCWNWGNPVVSHANLLSYRLGNWGPAGQLMNPDSSSTLLVVELLLKPFLPTPGLFSKTQEMKSALGLIALCVFNYYCFLLCCYLKRLAKATSPVTPKSKVPHFGLYNRISCTLCPQSLSELPVIWTINDLRCKWYMDCISSKDPEVRFMGEVKR